MKSLTVLACALLMAPGLGAQAVSSVSIVDSIVSISFVGGSNYNAETVLFRPDGTYQDIAVNSHFSGGGVPTSPPSSGTYSYSVAVGAGWEGPQSVGTITWTSGASPRPPLQLWFETPESGQPGASGVGVLSQFQVYPRSAVTGAVNMSSNSWVSAAHPMTPGFAIEGNVQRFVLVRGAGPSLAQFGVPSPVAAPQLALWGAGEFESGSNVDSWSADPNLVAGLQAVFSLVGAFPYTSGSGDCAGLFLLEPGVYTVQASTVGDAGQLLTEVYVLPYGD